MKIVSADITGSLIVNGVDVTTNVVSSSIFSGSIAGRVTSLEQFSASLDATFATDASVSASILVLSQSVQASQAALSSSYALTSGSYAAASASLSTRVTNLETTSSVVSSSFATTSGSLSTRVTNLESTSSIVSSSFATTSGSLSTRVTNLELTSSIVSSSFATTSGSLSGRVTLIEGQDATTGSNTFTGPQFINQASNAISFTSTASLYTDGGLRVSKDSYVSGTAYFNNVVVYGTSSIQYITSSQVNFGTNIITVNTDTPAVRFGGLAVFDSGSTQLTGSMLWDSQTNHWVYSNPSGSSYSGGMIMSGPRSSALGSEQGTTNNALMKGQGGDHITSSQMFDDGTTVRIPGNLQVTGSLYALNLTGSLNGSNLVNASVANAKLTNSTISGIALGSNLATLTIGTGLSGTSYNGSTGITIANTGVTSNVAGTGISINQGTGAVTITNSGVTSIVAGTGISINQGTGAVTITNSGVTSIVAGTNISISGGTGAVTITNGVTNNNQLTNGAGYITSAGNAATSTSTTFVASPDGGRNPNTAPLPTTNPRALSYNFAGASFITGATGNYAGVMTYAPWDGTSASTGDSSYQLAFCNWSGVNASGLPGLALRNGINSSWNSTWYQILHSGNVSSYTAGNVNSISSATGGAYTWTNLNYFRSNRNTSTDSPPLQAFSDNGGGAIMAFHRGGVFAINFGLDSDNVIRIGGWSASTNRLQMDMSGNLTMAGDVTAFSDARVKENVKTIENALSKTLALRGVSYNRTDSEDKKTKIGVIAQETLPIVPEVVNQDNDGMYNVSYGNLAGLFIEAIKEQQSQIEELKTIINGLTK